LQQKQELVSLICRWEAIYIGLDYKQIGTSAVFCLLEFSVRVLVLKNMPLFSVSCPPRGLVLERDFIMVYHLALREEWAALSLIPKVNCSASRQFEAAILSLVVVGAWLAAIIMFC
jgi:hypothetical protein